MRLRPSAATLTTRGLAIGYMERTVARDMDLSFARGGLVALIGPNGAGKTTLLRTLAGLLPPIRGEIFLGEDNLRALNATTRARRIGVVLTERPETGWLTGFDLVATGRHAYTGWDGRLSADDNAIVDQALARIGAEAFRDRPVADLSDGERQRVMVARALAQAPDILLLDEVTSFLDLPRRVQFFHLMADLAKAEGLVVVVSTHELELALRCADQLLLFDGDRLLKGAPEDLALSGDFARVFRGEGVDFDGATGHFELLRDARRSVELHGEGIRAQWTRRALERRGFKVAPTAEVVVTVGEVLWQCALADKTIAAYSIEDLLQIVDSFFETPI